MAQAVTQGGIAVGKPLFGRTEGGAGVESDNPAVRRDAMRRKDPPRLLPVLGP